ncbi:MAG: hypothetical protein ABSB24_16915, partial [Gaiellaceae bacterium]
GWPVAQSAAATPCGPREGRRKPPFLVPLLRSAAHFSGVEVVLRRADAGGAGVLLADEGRSVPGRGRAASGYDRNQVAT